MSELRVNRELTQAQPLIEPELLFSDTRRSLWVFSKPALWLSHPDGSERPDLISWARTRPELPRELTLIHRLDLGTSGLLCCAGDAEAAARWGAAWAEGRAHKRYLALAEGSLKRQGRISRALKDGRRGRPLEAQTRYRRLSALKGCALIELEITHGRKHQIRRHLQGIGSGVVGDKRYPPPKRSPLKGAPARLWLHASRLTLSLEDGAELELHAPLSSELISHLAQLMSPEDLASLTPAL